MKRINYSFICLAFAALAVSSVIIALLYKASPLFVSKTLFFCQKFIVPTTNLFISNIMFEVPRSLPNAVILTIGVILGIGLLSLLLQLIRTHLLLRKLLINRVSIPKGLVRIVATLGLRNQTSLSLRDKVILVDDKNLFSFCCGIFSPFIVITTGLVGSLTNKELEAVLLHEESHLISRDPLKVLIGKTLSSMFFFLPLFADLRKNIEAVNELLADQWTINHQQNSIFLRGALKKILAIPQLNFTAVSNVSGSDYFEVRIHRLVNPRAKQSFRLSRVSLITTFLFVLFSWFLLQTPVSAFHMDSESDSASFLCPIDQSYPKQCHSETEQPTNYIPTHLFLPEKQCNNHPMLISY